MALVTLLQAKEHLRVDSNDEDGLIQTYLQAAEKLCVSFLNRNVYESDAAMQTAMLDMEAGDHPMVVDDLIRSAVLLVAGHLYANREEVITGTIATRMPVGAEYLLMPHRKCMGV
jgi:hypothetical protein